MFQLHCIVPNEKAALIEEQLFALCAQSVSIQKYDGNSIVIDSIFESLSLARHAQQMIDAPISDLSTIAADVNNRWLAYVDTFNLLEDVYIHKVTADSSPLNDVLDEFHLKENGLVIGINAADTFGIGLHPSSRIAAQLMNYIAKEKDLTACNFLDIGCGSGLLSIYAERLGVTSVYAVDNSSEAVVKSRWNCEYNCCSKILVEEISLFDVEGSYDLVVANIPIALIECSVEKLQVLIASNGVLLLSGFTEIWADYVSKTLFSRYIVQKRVDLEGWTGFILV